MPDFGNGGSIFLFLKFATHAQFCVFLSQFLGSVLVFVEFYKEFQFNLELPF